MSPERKAKIKKMVEPARQTTQWVAIVSLLINSYFDSAKQKIANDIDTVKTMIQHAIVQQDKIETRLTSVESRTGQHQIYTNDELCHLWEKKQDKFIQTLK